MNNSLSDLIKGNKHIDHAPHIRLSTPRKYLHSEIQKTKHNGVNTFEVTPKSNMQLTQNGMILRNEGDSLIRYSGGERICECC